MPNRSAGGFTFSSKFYYALELSTTMAASLSVGLACSARSSSTHSSSLQKRISPQKTVEVERVEYGRVELEQVNSNEWNSCENVHLLTDRVDVAHL